MAGVYIKGMVMPAFCHVCPMYRIHHTGFSFCKHNNNAIPIVINGDNLFARPDWCPLVEVPDHGDLIDRDEWKKSLIDEEETIGIDRFSIDGLSADDVCYAIENAPVVIPADKEGV